VSGKRHKGKGKEAKPGKETIYSEPKEGKTAYEAEEHPMFLKSKEKGGGGG